MVDTPSVSTPRIATLFAYCRYSDHSTAADLIRGLIVQLLNEAPQSVTPIKELYDTHQRQKTTPTLSQTSAALRKALKLVERTQILIDGLDELDKEEEIGSLLDELSTFPAQVLIFSRRMELFQAEFPAVFLSIEARNEDIITFVNAGIKANRRLSSLLKKIPGLANEIVETIPEKSQGMCVPPFWFALVWSMVSLSPSPRFLVAQLQMEALKACPDAGSIRKTLAALPSKLDDMYELTLKRIDSQPDAIAAVARLALMWVSRAHRRLTVRQLLEAVATTYDPGSFVAGEFDTANMTTWEILSSATGGLLVAETDETVRLIRESSPSWLS